MKEGPETSKAQWRKEEVVSLPQEDVTKEEPGPFSGGSGLPPSAPL